MLFQSARQLDAYIERFVKGLQPEAGGAGNSYSSGGPKKVARQMGSAPPCGMCKELKTWGVLQFIPIRCLCAESKEELEAVKVKKGGQ